MDTTKISDPPELEPFDDELKFRCARSMRRRAQRLAKAKGIRSYQGMVREIVATRLAQEEKRLKLPPLPKHDR
jgi:hypothetical protein